MNPRDVVQDLVDRRLWPIPVAAAVVVLGAPVLFLHGGSDPAGAAQAGQAPAPAASAKGDAATSSSTRSGATTDAGGRDPFGAAPSTAPAASGTSAGSLPHAVVPHPAAKASPSVTKHSVKPTPAPRHRTRKIQPTHTTTPKPTTKARTTMVDVRYGASREAARLHHGVRPAGVFKVDDTAVAMFVRYSPKSHKAVFAVSPSAIVTGSVTCRRVKGFCRYVDVPKGGYARLTFLAGGKRVVRRLDVVRVRLARG